MNSMLHLVGIAKKAGRLEVGEEPVGAAARARQAKLILVAGDAAENSARRASHFAEAGKVPWVRTAFTKAEMGAAVGRASCAMLALTDMGLAAALITKLAAENPEHAAVAEELTRKAEKVLQRQKEQRVHEKRVREGANKKPWSPPPKGREAQARPQTGAPQKRPTPRGVVTVKKKTP